MNNFNIYNHFCVDYRGKYTVNVSQTTGHEKYEKYKNRALAIIGREK